MKVDDIDITLRELTCEVCGKKYYRQRSDSKTCSLACRLKKNRKKQKEERMKQLKRFNETDKTLRETDKTLRETDKTLRETDKMFQKEKKRADETDELLHETNKSLQELEQKHRRSQYILSGAWWEDGCLNCGSQNIGLLRRSAGPVAMDFKDHYYVHCNDCWKDIDRDEYIEARYKDI